MEENNVIPDFLVNTVNQLLKFKTNISSKIDNINNEKQKISSNDINNYAEKINNLIEEIEISMVDIDSMFYENYNSLKKNFQKCKQGSKSLESKTSNNSSDSDDNIKQTQIKNKNIKKKSKKNVSFQDETNLNHSDIDNDNKNSSKLRKKKKSKKKDKEPVEHLTKQLNSDIDNDKNELESKKLSDSDENVESQINSDSSKTVNINNDLSSNSNKLKCNKSINNIDQIPSDKNLDITLNDLELNSNKNNSETIDKDKSLDKNVTLKRTNNEIHEKTNNSEIISEQDNNKTLEDNEKLTESVEIKATMDKIIDTLETNENIESNVSNKENEASNNSVEIADLDNTLNSNKSLFDESIGDDIIKTTDDESLKEEKVKIEEEKPKFGLIKCIDITKLLDPEIINEKQKANLCNGNNKKDDSIITLSSDSENEPVTPVIKTHSKEHKRKNKHEIKKDLNTEIDNTENETLSKRRHTRRSAIGSKANAFNELQKIRENKNKRVTHKDKVSSSDNDSDSNIKSKSTEKNKSTKKITLKNYDYNNDIKMKSRCYVSLPKIPVEKLKEYYLEREEDKEINRLTNMKTLKRTKLQKDVQSSSDSDTNIRKKRSKLQKKKGTDGSGSDQSNPNSDIDFDPIPNDKSGSNGKTTNALAAEDMLASSNDEVDKNSDNAGEENTSKNKEKKDKKHKEKNKNEESSKNEQNKWKNDPLLKEKLDENDSEEELNLFRKKQETLANKLSGNEDDEIIPKKRKSKRQVKRVKRLLDSDASSSEDSDNEKRSSSAELFKSNEKASSSSDSEEEKEENVKAKKRSRIKKIKDSDESSDDDKEKKKIEDVSTRKKIRHVWNKDSLAEATKAAAKEEIERKKRIAERQKLYNDIYVKNLDANAKVDKVILDFNEETKEELLSVHPELVGKLKPHQAKGVQFMWTACFESLERAKKTEGSGCILAHCMGLGKTLQVITLIHTLLTNSDKTNVRTALVVCPLSTVLNWVSEFKKWLDDVDSEQVNVFDLVQYKQNYERLYQLQDWMKFGGVMVMGYDMFRNLSNPKGKRMSKKLSIGFTKVLLEPGPDLVVCDEGHLLKNEKTGISIAMNRLKTKRRIVLTGTPLQNNLKEYFCMVQFVKPNLLGTYKEYLNRFVNPITNGQYTNSTPHDIYIMRKRAHVLHKMLDAIVERRDYNVLAPFLPPKHEYVLFISLTEVQINLYKEYLEKFARNAATKGTSFLFSDFQELQRICIHPRVLLDKSKQDKLKRDMEMSDEEGSLKDFIDDDEEEESAKSSTHSSSENSSSGSGDEQKTAPTTRSTRANPNNIEEVIETVEHEEWWSKHCQNDELDNICYSSKIKLLFDILHQCELIGDKVLVFSQSLYSLNLIEYFLSKIDEATQNGDQEALKLVGGNPGSWALGLDYFRLDGSTSCDNRATWCASFNSEQNTRARLFLISTRAGGLGINLVAANRVIIFDVSWNPSYDIQSIYRVYRFGQIKPCYIYRFVTMGTMENKIYERQVTKQAISKRVIDEQQIDRHYNQHDLAELYAFNPVPEEERPIPLVPKDRLFADLLQTHEKEIFKYHEHNSLLENKEDEGLNEAERQAAWDEFENEKKAPQINLMQTMIRNGMYETLRVLVQQDNATWTPAQVNNALPLLVQRISEQVTTGDYTMYKRVEENHKQRLMEQRRMQMVYQTYLQQLRNSGVSDQLIAGKLNKFGQSFNPFSIPGFSGTTLPGASTSYGNIDTPVVSGPPIPHPTISEVIDLND